jgi:hypothetical protein
MVDGGCIGLEWMGWDGMCIDKVRYWYQDVCIAQCRNNKRADGCLLGERPVGVLVSTDMCSLSVLGNMSAYSSRRSLSTLQLQRHVRIKIPEQLHRLSTQHSILQSAYKQLHMFRKQRLPYFTAIIPTLSRQQVIALPTSSHYHII